MVIPNIALLFQKHKKSSELEAALMITEIVVQMDCDTGECLVLMSGWDCANVAM